MFTSGYQFYKIYVKAGLGHSSIFSPFMRIKGINGLTCGGRCSQGLWMGGGLLTCTEFLSGQGWDCLPQIWTLLLEMWDHAAVQDRVKLHKNTNEEKKLHTIVVVKMKVPHGISLVA
jgi:hypothetical protein